MASAKGTLDGIKRKELIRLTSHDQSGGQVRDTVSKKAHIFTHIRSTLTSILTPYWRALITL